MGVFPAPTTGGGGGPTGPAGGVLGGAYPNPGFAVDMATQAELDAVVAAVASTFAPLASPALTGNPTVPTQTPGTNNTRAASTAYADAGDTAVIGFVASAFAPLASPALTGNPTVPTQAPGTNNTRAASTAYTDTAIAAMGAVVAPLDVTVTSKTASFTLAASDDGDLLLANHATVAIVCTLPTNASVPIPIGAQFQISRTGAAAVSFAAQGGVTLNSKTGVTPAIQAQWTSASATKTAVDTWLVEGNL